MSLQILSVHHRRHGLSAVERTAADAPAVAAALRRVPGVAAVLALTTCNRVELLVDADGVVDGSLVAALADAGCADPGWEAFEGRAAVAHLFRVTAGLESLVVGEREIAGQIRRALVAAQAASPTLTLLVEDALRVSRRVGRETALATAGRSIVSAALDLAGPVSWADQRVLLVGTGSFAGACVAALRTRGARRIQVQSASGRAEQFARDHRLGVAPALAPALAEADVVVACRGTGSPALTAADVAADARLLILDLALHSDVTPEVAALPGVAVIGLETLRESLSSAFEPDTTLAEEIVEEGVDQVLAKLRARELNPAVVGLRQSVLELVDAEVDRLPKGRPLDVDDAAKALHRLASKLLHGPSSRAREAAASGRTEEYLSAMAELYGIGGRDASAAPPDGGD